MKLCLEQPGARARTAALSHQLDNDSSECALG